MSISAISRNRARCRTGMQDHISELSILSGGAARGLVNLLSERFTAETGLGIAGEFSAVGAMAARLRDGVRADLVILTSSLVADLTREGLLIDGSARDLGVVLTGVAFRSGDTAAPV